MSKSVLSKAVKQAAGITAEQADAAVEAVIDTIISTTKADGKFNIYGFGTFSKSERPARKGRNPKTGESIEIGPSRSFKFSAAAALKKSL